MSFLDTLTAEARETIRAEAAAGAKEAVLPWIVLALVVAVAAYLKK